MLSFMNARKNNDNKASATIESVVLKIQRGNLSLREQFILDYKPFILKCVSKYTHNYVNAESSDEFSIALIAFNESIGAYKIVKGLGFLAFSEIVIKNRLTDNVRKNSNQRNVLPFVTLETKSDDGSIEPYDIAADDPSFIRIEIMEEINSLSLNLKEYGILFKDLIKCSPKHRDTRKRLASLARIIYDNTTLLSKLKRTKTIPINDLLEITSVYRGTVEQNRKYIIALVLVLDSKLEVLKSYVDGSCEGGGQYAN